MHHLRTEWAKTQLPLAPVDSPIGSRSGEMQLNFVVEGKPGLSASMFILTHSASPKVMLIFHLYFRRPAPLRNSR